MPIAEGKTPASPEQQSTSEPRITLSLTTTQVAMLITNMLLLKQLQGGDPTDSFVDF